MPRVITITIPDEWSDVKAVDQLVDEFQSELGHLCNDADEWTDEEREVYRDVSQKFKDFIDRAREGL